jgi:hypothetical protein
MILLNEIIAKYIESKATYNLINYMRDAILASNVLLSNNAEEYSRNIYTYEKLFNELQSTLTKTSFIDFTKYCNDAKLEVYVYGPCEALLVRFKYSIGDTHFERCEPFSNIPGLLQYMEYLINPGAEIDRISKLT